MMLWQVRKEIASVHSEFSCDRMAAQDCAYESRYGRVARTARSIERKTGQTTQTGQLIGALRALPPGALGYFSAALLFGGGAVNSAVHGMHQTMQLGVVSRQRRLA